MSFVSSYYGKTAVFITKSILGVRKGFNNQILAFGYRKLIFTVPTIFGFSIIMMPMIAIVQCHLLVVTIVKVILM